MSEVNVGPWEGTADLTNSGFDKEGNLTLTFTFHPGAKYDVMPATDVRGKSFHVSVRSNSERIAVGKSGIEEARARVLARKTSRQIGGVDLNDFE